MTLDFSKLGGLVPAVIQDNTTNIVLMLGFMDEAALQVSGETGRVTVFNRTENRLDTVGAENGAYLNITSISANCDNDALLIRVNPEGTVSLAGADTCWGESNTESGLVFLEYLQDIIDQRKLQMPEGSYTTRLFNDGTRKIAQKVGEEAVETIIGAMANDDKNFLYEGADLLYHLMVLLTHKGYRIEDLVSELKSRHKD
jgi:phosphoribosyl-AMP cyclohydrolase / phosphoribosyl-ATP pyrophosphohydrolase